jgi:serine protease AprX
MAHTTLRRAATRTLLGAFLVSGLGTLPAVPAAAAAPAAGPAAAPAVAVPHRAHALDPGLALTGPDARVIVTGGAGVASAVRAAGGRVLDDLPLVDGVSAVVPAARLRSLADARAVHAVTADRDGRFVDFAWEDTPTASTFTRTVQATSSWTRGHYGKGVGVAVLDTGVSPMPDLADRLVHGPDLSGEGTLVDSYGHGTVMAGLIAGNGAASVDRVGGAFPGVAPAAHVVSVKVAGRNGVVDVSTVLEAMHWISAYRQQYGIRVLNLSWGVASTQSPSVDPVNHAVQRLWSEGIVVVVAAGNSGSSSGTITKPGDDPVVLTVGAYDDKGDLEPNNDGIPQWSSRGPTAAGIAKPDLVAPGRTVVSLRSPGSTIEQNNPKALLAPSYIRGSGTSQAAAVTSGAAALLLANRPTLTPDQVKALLTSTALPIANQSRFAQGSGRVQLEAAVAAPAPTGVQSLSASGLGTIDASRGVQRVVATCNGAAVEIRGEIDVRCQPWDGSRWAGSRWSTDSWTGSAWKGSEWTGSAWKGVSWSDAVWTGSAWKGGTWLSTSWYGTSGWNGDTTATSPWTGSAWKSSEWTGSAWKEGNWTTGEWTTAEHDEFLTAFWGSTPKPGKRVKGEPFTASERSGG